MDLSTELLKLLGTKHFTKPPPRPKVGLAKLAEALRRLGTPGIAPEAIVEPLLGLKGRGWAQTAPKIIMKEEFAEAQFEVWPTPLGLTELARRVADTAGGAPPQTTPAAGAPPPPPAAPRN